MVKTNKTKQASFVEYCKRSLTHAKCAPKPNLKIPLFTRTMPKSLHPDQRTQVSPRLCRLASNESLYTYRQQRFESMQRIEERVTANDNTYTVKQQDAVPFQLKVHQNDDDNSSSLTSHSKRSLVSMCQTTATPTTSYKQLFGTYYVVEVRAVFLKVANIDTINEKFYTEL